MRNDTGRNKPERPFKSSRKTGTAERRKTKTRRETYPQHTDAQRETMRTGLRVLARMIARAHLRRQADLGEPEPPPEPGAGR